MDIRVEHLSKKFQKNGASFWAVNDLNFEAKKGDVFGLLGPNGAGKTTTFKIISTLLYPDKGRVTIGDLDTVSNVKEIRKILGVSFGNELIYHRLTARTNLVYYARIYGVSNPKDRADELLAFMNLSDRANDLVETFSLGMKSRLAIARSILHDPPVLLFDEPTTGLDPSFAIELRELISKMAKEKTILLSTHYMQEADQICDKIGLIDKGSIIAMDNPENIKTKLDNKTYVISGVFQPELVDQIKEIMGVKSAYISKGMLRIIFTNESYLKDVDRLIEKNRTKDLKMQQVSPTLEDAFISLVSS